VLVVSVSRGSMYILFVLSQLRVEFAVSPPTPPREVEEIPASKHFFLLLFESLRYLGVLS